MKLRQQVQTYCGEVHDLKQMHSQQVHASNIEGDVELAAAVEELEVSFRSS